MRKEWVARELMMEIAVGTFLVVVFLGIGFFTVVLSRQAWFRTTYPIEVVFDTVSGLRPEDAVVVRGMTVGKVRRLHLQKDGVHVFATLDAPIHPRLGYRMSIVTTSILGGRYLEIDEGPAGQPLPEDTVYRGDPAANLMGDAGDVLSALRKGLMEGGIVSNLQVAAVQIRDITERVNSGKGTIGRLLSEDDTLYTNLTSSVTALKSITERLDRGEGTLGRLLSKDDRLYEDLSATIGSLKTVSGRLERGEGTLGRLLSPDDTLYKDLSATMASLKNITYRVAQGEGSIGRLMKDDELYTEVKKTVEELRAAIDDFRENTPVVTFSSLVFGAF
jgi:phospholipid/cholesterol/gamma-HCH transport system substrate-binding protein